MILIRISMEIILLGVENKKMRINDYSHIKKLKYIDILHFYKFISIMH